VRGKKLIIILLGVIVSCLGLLLLSSILSAGLLAIRKVLPASATATFPTALLPAVTRTPTPIWLPSPTKARIPSPTALLFTEAVLPSATFEQPTAGSVPAPTQPLVGFVPGGWCVPWNSPSLNARVLKVIDGASFEVSIDNVVHQVRYIGLDLLEYSDDPSKWSAMIEKNRSLVEGKTVLLIEGTQDDVGDPLERYVIADGFFVNLELIEGGYAMAITEPANNLCQAVFNQAQNDAIAAGRGLWAATPTPTRTLIPATATVSPLGEVVVVNVSKRGNGWQEPEEYVEIFNSGTAPVQLQGWSLSDNDNHIFWFPSFVLGPGQYCRVYTDQYWPEHCGFTYHNPAPIWDNNGDCAYLKDFTGKLVDTFCYD
jgi:endonuclease YncB( thermonuclease family)